MIRPSDMKVILSKVVFDESDDNELENRKGAALKEQMQLQKNKDHILKLVDDLYKKMDYNYILDCQMCNNDMGIEFDYKFVNNLRKHEIVHFNDGDKKLNTIENYIKEKTGYLCSIDTKGISVCFVFEDDFEDENKNLCKSVYNILDCNITSDCDLDFFNTNNFENLKKACRFASELLDDVITIINFVHKHIDITIDKE